MRAWKNCSADPFRRSNNRGLIVDPLPISTTVVTKERLNQDENVQIWRIGEGLY
jgi:hypothetical protein